MRKAESQLRTVEEANDAQMMRASALVLRDVMAERSVDTMRETREEHRRQVHYLSMEFLMGRSLMKNAFNLALLEPLVQVCWQRLLRLSR